MKVTSLSPILLILWITRLFLSCYFLRYATKLLTFKDHASESCLRLTDTIKVVTSLYPSLSADPLDNSSFSRLVFSALCNEIVDLMFWRIRLLLLDLPRGSVDPEKSASLRRCDIGVPS
jgi:hypothetical protein